MGKQRTYVELEVDEIKSKDENLLPGELLIKVRLPNGETFWFKISQEEFNKKKRVFT